MKKNDVSPEKEGAKRGRLSRESFSEFDDDIRRLKGKEQEEVENSKEGKGGENREGKVED